MAIDPTTTRDPAADGVPTASGMVSLTDWDQFDPGPYKAFPGRRERVQEFWLMSRYDPTIKLSLYMLRLLILRNLGDYEHPDEALQERVRELLGKSVDGAGPGAIMREMLSALWAGYSVVEPVWGMDGGWYIEDAALLHPLSFFDPQTGAAGIKLDVAQKRVAQVTQYQDLSASLLTQGATGPQSVTLPVERVVYWPLQAELREECYGNSLLDGARKAWYSKVKQETYWNTFAQKCAMPTPVFWVPQTSIYDARAGQQKSLAEFLPGVYERLQPGQGVAIPIDMDMPYKLETLVPTGDGSAFETICRYWDQQLFKAVLTPRLLVEEPEHASRAQSGTVMDLFMLTIDGIESELGSVFIDQLVRPLIVANVGERADGYGEWSWGELQSKDLEALARIFEALERGKATAVQAGQPISDLDDDILRETFPDLYAAPDEIAEYREQLRVMREEERAAKAEARARMDALLAGGAGQPDEDEEEPDEDDAE